MPPARQAWGEPRFLSERPAGAGLAPHPGGPGHMSGNGESPRGWLPIMAAMALRDTPHPSDAAAADAPIDVADDVGHYRVLLARDARFDGRLFVGVSSTGVYCRPICRVRTPKPQNCRFFTTAAQAEAAAYRPCLKCRPELAPGPGGAWTVMDASRTLARQAAALLDGRTADAGGDASVATLATRLGVSERHLRRIFVAEHGVTPLQYLQTRRLLLAKQLLTDTRLPVTQVALASGWRSLRRFNAAFTDRYRLSPSRLRAGRPAADGQADAEQVEVHLAYREPYDRARLLAFFAQRAIPGIETVDGLGVVRSLRAGALGGDPARPSPAGWVAARFDAGAPLMHLRIAPALVPLSGPLIAAARRWFDLAAQPAVIDTALAALPGEPGLRLPGSLDAFELAVRAVLGQQVTVAAARTLAARLVARHGDALTTPWPEVTCSFPRPQALASLGIDDIAGLGIIRSRAGAILALAADWPAIEPLLSPALGPQALIERLRGVPGIGPWTAHYIAMRALGWPDAFPPGDVAVLKAMRGLPGMAPASLPPGAPAPGKAATLNAARLAAETCAQAWRPWRSYAVLRLWNSLGELSPTSTPPLATQDRP